MARKLELDLVAKSNADVVLNRVQKASENFAADLTKRFTSAFGAMALFDKGLALAEAGLHFVADSFKKYADIADQAQKAGMDGEDFQRLAAAAEEAGVSMQTVGKAARELRILMKDAASGNQLALEKLKALGYTEEQVRSGTIKTTDIFLQLAKAMEGATSDADKLAIMTAIFGDKVAADLLPLLDQTRAKLRQTFGDTPIMSNATLEQMDTMMDKLTRLFHLLQFISATGAFNLLFGKGPVGGMTKALGLLGVPGFQMIGQTQAALDIATSGSSAGGPDTGPNPDSATLTALGSKIGEASLGSGVIGVGASPQIALAQEANTTLQSMDSKLGLLVNAGIDKDPTKPLNRKYPLYSPGLQR
jgi:hypothetical protein